MLKPYYSDEKSGIVIYCGLAEEILPQIESADHVITDPPYEIEAHTLGRRARAKGGGEIYTERPLDFDPMTTELRLLAGREFARISKGWILVFCQVEAAMLWRDALAPARYYRTQIWRKANGAPQFTGDRPGMGYESITTCWAGESRSKWNGGGRHGVYDHPVERHMEDHLTMKPLSLMTQLISLFSDAGETILDPFMGSGTTLLACKQLGRHSIGVEKEEKYCEVAAKRLSQGVLGL